MSDVTLEIQGLEITGYHGATEREQREGQRFVYDVWISIHDAGVRSDDLRDTVDYTNVVACLLEVSETRRFNLIEALAAAAADAIVAKFPIARVRVRVRKPEVRLDAPVEYTAATVERGGRG
ncbi:MAG: dihydroneopterin aldolase [Actinobacteria bacterium]|nr:dihydroneopterin aldolase [Actinomycetota bacterium]